MGAERRKSVIEEDEETAATGGKIALRKWEKGCAETNVSHACVLSRARYIPRLFYESVHPKTRSLFAFYMPPFPPSLAIRSCIPLDLPLT